MTQIALLASALILATPQTPPASSAQDLTRNLNQAPPAATTSQPAATPPAATPTTRTEAAPASQAARPAPDTARDPNRPAPTASPTPPPGAATSTGTPPAPTTRGVEPAAAAARPAPTPGPDTARDPNRPSPTGQPNPPPGMATAPAASTAGTAAPTAAPATPPAPAPVPLTAAERAALPFAVTLPVGFEIMQRPSGPGAKIYDVRRSGRLFAMIYAGPSSQFPVYSGEVRHAGGRASVVAVEDGIRHAVEHLYERTTDPKEIHVWVNSLDGADRVTAESIAASVEPR